MLLKSNLWNLKLTYCQTIGLICSRIRPNPSDELKAASTQLPHYLWLSPLIVCPRTE